jgi:hypothetical protein
VSDWPIWDLDWQGWAVLALLLASGVQYGATSGVLASMGKNGRLRHRWAELVGAVRGVVAFTALQLPMLVIWALDSFRSAERLGVYMDAALVLAAVYVPMTLVSGISFAVVHVTPWKVRSNINAMVFGTLVFLRPYVAFSGMAAAAVVSRDVGVTVLGFVAVATGVQATRLTKHWWYSRPVRLEDLGVR